MFLIFLWSCFPEDKPAKDSSVVDLPPQKIDIQQDQSVLGRLAAEKSIEKGELQILSFGEYLPPDTLDSKTGLPLSSMGCSFSEAKNKYLIAHNDVIKNWLQDNTPFPKDMVVVFSSSRSDIQKSYKVTHSDVFQKENEDWKTIPSSFAQRLKVGVLAQQSTGLNVPASKNEKGPTFFLSVQRKDKDWSISWSGEHLPPKRVKATMDSILAIQ